MQFCQKNRRPHRLPSTLMFDHPTTKAIATFAAEQLATVVSDAWMRWPQKNMASIEALLGCYQQPWKQQETT